MTIKDAVLDVGMDALLIFDAVSRVGGFNRAADRLELPRAASLHLPWQLA